jgi:hypothetical protein
MLASVRALLSSIVDYAGLFPPAQLDLKNAIETYHQARSSPEHWMLGQFVIPAARWPEFCELTTNHKSYSFSLILSKQWKAELEQISSDEIASLEFPPLPPHEIKDALRYIPSQVEAFFEIPFNVDLDDYLPIFKNFRSAIKIRTGGITQDMFPIVGNLTEFILALATHKISFKATAGLHHPLPGQYPLTYEPNSDSAQMHGFLNIAIAAALAYHHKLTESDVLEILKTSLPEAFQFTDDSVSWRDRSLNLAEIETARQQFFRSFGSCSFHEPVTDLKTLALL